MPKAFDVLSFIHTTCLGVSWGFLLSCSITSPALKRSGFLYYNTSDGYHQYSFGVFGYCNSYLHTNPCVSALGYSVYGLFRQAGSEGASSPALDISYSYLTKYLLLVPMACAVSFAAALLTFLQHRRGKILFSSSLLALLAFCFTLPSLVMEELLFNQLYKDIKVRPGSTVQWGIPRYLLMIAMVTTFVAAVTGFIAARRAHTDRGRYAAPGAFSGVALGPYQNLDKQGEAAHSSLLTVDGRPAGRTVSPSPISAHHPYDPYGNAFSAAPSPAPSPGPYQQYDNPYDTEHRR